jgi:hypothetical protein
MIAPTLASYLVPDSPDSRHALDQLRVRIFHESQIIRCEAMLADYLKNMKFWNDALSASRAALVKLSRLAH